MSVFSGFSASSTTINASIGLRKRSASVFSLENDETESILPSNPSTSRVSRPKRVRKASSNAQFSVFEDDISLLNSYSYDSYCESFLINSTGQLSPTGPKIVVEIPFRSNIYQNSGFINSQRPLQSISTNRGSKARSIPKNWSKKQPNDYTIPSISDNFMTDSHLIKLLIPPKEAEEHFKGRPIVRC